MLEDSLPGRRRLRGSLGAACPKVDAGGRPPKGAKSRAQPLTVYMRNMSTWGPGTQTVLRRQIYDVYIFPETHKSSQDMDEMLEDIRRASYAAVATPARPSHRSVKAGGVVLCAKSRYKLHTYRHLAAKADQQRGWRDTASMSFKPGPLDFFDYVVASLKVRGVPLTVIGVYLDAGIGIAGANIQKLANLAAFVNFRRR